MNELETQWQINASKLIFYERYKAVLPIQTTYRRYRTMKQLIKLNEQEPYNNPLLADIPLGSYRIHIKFHLPKSIRDIRRIVWFSSIKIQAIWRCFVLRRIYNEQMKRVKTVQSVSRMYPAKLKYLQARIKILKIQTWIRMILTRKYYHIVRNSAMIIQRTVRMYFCLLLKAQMQEDRWTYIERKHMSILILQVAIRQYLAKLHTQRIRDEKALREKSALFLQRVWYRRNGAFHTFLLMSCYRVLELEEEYFNKYVITLERMFSARKIQRYYHKYDLYRKNISAIILQRWYRGRRGYLFTCQLRQYTYASRKLHHWGRAKIRYRHVMIRKIQNLWWRFLPGRLMRHLDYKGRFMDQIESAYMYKIKYNAATRVQVAVRRARDKWEYYRHKCSRRIQKRFRRYRRNVQWYEFKIQTTKAFSIVYTDACITASMNNIINKEINKISIMLIRPQAIIRGYLVRKEILREKLYQLLIQNSAQKIQIWWKSEQEKMKRLIFKRLLNKGASSNPYKSVHLFNELLRLVNHDTRKYLSILDPRIGLSLSNLLIRLNLEEYLEMFPKSKYTMALDLHKLRMKDMVDLFENWQNRLEKESIARGTYKGGTKRPVAPKDIFECILSVVTPRLYVSAANKKKHIENIAPFLEIETFDSGTIYLRTEFLKKFGNSLVARAQNMASAVMSESYKSYNNYMMCGERMLTKAYVMRIMSTCTNSNDVKTLLLQHISKAYQNTDDIKRIRQRCKNCLKCLEYAMDKSLMILDAGLLGNLIYKVATQIYQYKKRFSYLYMTQSRRNNIKVDLSGNSVDSGTNTRRALTNKNIVDGSVRGLNTYTAATKKTTRSSTSSGLTVPIDIPLQTDIIYSTLQSTHRAFIGTPEYKDIEYTISQCKLYLSVFEVLYMADCGFRVLQCIYRYNVYKALVRRGRLALFLNSEKLSYKYMKERNNVRPKWEQFRRIEAVAISMQSILSEKLLRRYSIETKLSVVPRYGWSYTYDEENNVIWKQGDDLTTLTSNPPIYNLFQWRAVEMIQKAYRRHLLDVIRRKELGRLEEVRRIEMEKKKAGAYTLKHLSVHITAEKDTAMSSSYRAVTEMKLPRRLEFDTDYILKPRMWLLMKMAQTEEYRVVLILRVRMSKGNTICDVRTVQDEILRDVPGKRIFKLKLDIGSVVEVRYKGLTAFYRGKVTSFKHSNTGMEDFNILYDDGEYEAHVPSLFIRIPQTEVNTRIMERQAYLRKISQFQKRSEHYNSLGSLRSKSTLDHGSDIDVRIKYTRKSARFGWEMRQVNNQVIYYNTVEQIKSYRSKEYTPEESAAVLRIQTLCRIHIAKMRLRQLLSQFTVDHISKNAIESAKKTAFIGYKLEGVTTLQTLRRAGYWQIAHEIELFMKEKPVQLGQLTMKALTNLNLNKLASIGIVGDKMEHSLKSFQEWWKKTTPEKRQEKLTLLNYFTSPYDVRTLQECIHASKENITTMFLKSFPNNAQRVNNAIKVLITSLYPHTYRQIDVFLKEYAGKPSLAQDHINELINVPILHSEKEEEEVYHILHIASKRLCVLLKNFKIKSMLARILETIEKAEKIIITNTDRKCAKAALLLRVDSLEYTIICLKQTVILQRHLRGFTRRHIWTRTKEVRLIAAKLIQRNIRRMFVRSLRLVLLQQQHSIYEQLWDDHNKCMYYYNNTTGESSYEEPHVLFRPLVRDFYSDNLILAWPQLENPSQYLTTDTGLDAYSCTICKVRESIRVCLDCTIISPYGGVNYTSYCFPCFATCHSSADKETHNYKDSEATSSFDAFLKCSQCDKPATRKCLGFLSDKRLDELCSILAHANINNWEETLLDSKLFEEKKIQLLLDNVVSSNATSGASQLNHLKSLLGRMKSECDECYCTNCYKDMHIGGKRLNHIWIGFIEYAPACPVCTRSPSEMRCFECNESLCSSCYKVLHSMGKKRRHKYMLITENNPNMAPLCPICIRRVATIPCPKQCGTIACDSCYECVHIEYCPNKTNPDIYEHICVVCSESADLQCLDCGDLYCSRKWMGNPGCFVKNHSKGNRIKHRVQSLKKIG